MNVVLYTRDMEPITIIDLPMWAIEMGEKERHIAVPVRYEPEFRYVSVSEPVPELAYRVVILEFHRLMLGRNKSSWLVTVNDDELALLLRPAWLPGQRSAINDYERTTRDLARALLEVLAAGRR